MPLNETTEAELLAYAYGELSTPQARAFEQRLQGDAELRAELESVQATRDLFGRDARFGVDTKVDAPPPHLLDAILRAEVLARPPEIRAARALEGRPTLTARLSRWLIGGGVLIGATAALLVVVTKGTREAVLEPMPAAAEAPASAPKELAKAEAPKSEAIAQDLSGKLVALPSSALPDAPEPTVRVDRRPKPDEPADDGERDNARDLAAGDRGAVALGLTGPGGGGATPADAPADAALAKDERKSSVATIAPTTGAAASTRSTAGEEGRAQASLGGSSDDAFGFDSLAGGRHAANAAAPAAAAPPPPAKPTATPMPASPRRSDAPMAPPSEAPALQERPSASSLDMLSREDMQVERRRLADERHEQNEKRKKGTASFDPAATTDGKAAEQAAPAKGAGSYAKAGAKADAKKPADKAPSLQPGPEPKRAMQAEVALVSGYRELKEGRPFEALDEFQSAERLDARRSLGSDPHVGQIRALLALKRPAEALAVARRLVTRNLAEGGVADGLLLGANTAEQVGDLRTARELWTALLKAPAHKSVATAALARLAHPAVRAPADADTAEAEEAPAAAAPASKE